jgi:hypothetical protein
VTYKTINKGNTTKQSQDSKSLNLLKNDSEQRTKNKNLKDKINTKNYVLFTDLDGLGLQAVKV